MEATQKNHLVDVAKRIRKDTVRTIAGIGSGHIGGSLSIADVLAVLYFEKMNVDPKNPQKPDRDRLVLSKGHAGPALYATLAMKGYFPDSWLDTLNQPGTNLPSHCDMIRTPGIDMTAGSLGQGISCAVGMAVAAKVLKMDNYIYTIVGDGESQEGQVWEAGMYASQKKLDNLIAFTDNNKMQISGNTDDVCSICPLDEKWEAFGFYVQVIDGHDVQAISAAIDNAKAQKEKPSMIILETVKGKGVKVFEDAGFANHSMAVTADDVAAANEQLK